MSKETYSIPTSPSACYDFERDVIPLCVTNAKVWGIPDDKITSITVLRTDYELKYGVTNNRSTQSPSATAAREAAWSPLKDGLTDMFNHYLLNNDAISTEDKETLHIHLTSTGGGSPTPAPTTTPIISLTAEEISVLHVVYADSSSPTSHSKPLNVAFCEMCYKVDGAAPASPSECTERYNVARSHEGIVFAAEQRGKALYGFGRWVNRNGKYGPWGGMFSSIIP
jgi:hypothetical protein